MRLFGWWRRSPAPRAGRHSRALPAPTVPGAAASLVIATAEALSEPEADPAAPGPYPHPEPVPAAVQAQEPLLVDRSAAVTLGFADGASVALADDDPRVRTFRAAAAALLDQPRA